MVFQSYALYPHKTVARQHGLRAASCKKMDKAEIAERVQTRGRDPRPHALSSTAIRAQLSGGQRQRVAMGRAIVRDPQVFLFDEPLSNLDAKLRVQMRTEIKELHQRLKTTTVYVTHDQVEAMTMADQIVVMQDGHHRADRRAAGALRPAGQSLRRRLHRLAGDEHAEGHACRTGPAACRRTGDRAPPSRCPRQRKRHDGPGSHLRRPARASRPADDGGVAGARLSVVEPTGSETVVVFLRFGESEMVALFRERHDFQAGRRTLHLRPRPELGASVRQRQSGKRL